MPQRTVAEPSWDDRIREEGGQLLSALKDQYAENPDHVFSMEWVDEAKDMLQLKGNGITVEVSAGRWGGAVCLVARGFRDSQGPDAFPYFSHYFPRGASHLLEYMDDEVFLL